MSGVAVCGVAAYTDYSTYGVGNIILGGSMAASHVQCVLCDYQPHMIVRSGHCDCANCCVSLL